MQLRNCILIALAFDCTDEEVAYAHELIDRVAGGADPSILVTAAVNGTTGAVETTNAATGNITLDAAGLPWDERIHSSNKKLNDKGLWWAKRGVTPALKSKVEAEIRTSAAATATTTSAPSPQPTATATTNTPPMPGSNTPPMPGAAQIDPAYAALVQYIAANTTSAANPAGKLNDQYVTEVLKHYGVAEGSLQNLAHAPQLVPTVHQWFVSVVNGTA